MNELKKPPSDEPRNSWAQWFFQLFSVITGFYLPKFSNSTRPNFGNVGRVIYNTDDQNLNIDIGTNWILPDGTIT